jgi:4'-phosphopantetheinyl transferase
VDGVDLWCVRLNVTPANAACAYQALSGDEWCRLRRVRLPLLQQRKALGWAAVRGILARYLGCPAAAVEIERTCHGKPRLAASQRGALCFNYSHSGPHLLVAVARGVEVGIDVEQVRELSVATFTRAWCTRADHVRITRLPAAQQSRAALQLWTQSEAYWKGVGTGVRLRWRADGNAAGERWRVTAVTAPADCVAALARARLTA